MYVLLLMGMIEIGMGILGFRGSEYARIQRKYMNHTWTKEYKKKNGLTYFLLGVSMIVIYFLSLIFNLGLKSVIVLIILITIPIQFYQVKINKSFDCR